MRLFSAVLLSCTLVGATFVGSDQSATAQDAADAPSSVVRPAKIITLEPEATRPTRRFFGRIVARSTVDIAFQVGGEIVVFDVAEGDRIDAGAVIAQLDLERYELALRSAELSLQQAERDFERQRNLGPNVTSQANIDDAETARDLAEVARREAERNLEDATLTAPFNGLIATRYVDAFTTIDAGVQVVRIHDMSELRVEIDVPELLFRQAQGAEDFNIYATLAGDDAQYPLITREFNAETTQIGQAYRITLAFTGAVDERVLPGATVTVVAEPITETDAIYLPTSALIIAPDDSVSVMVFEPGEDGSGAVRRVAIEVETSNGGARVRAVSGVSAGDQIVAAGPDRLSDGQTVRVFEGLSQ